MAAPATPASVATTTTAPGTAQSDLEEVVVHGIKRGDLIMPTTVTSDSAYGLDLGVMDTPRNNTVLSKVQIDALDVQNPGGFSYLTSSAYTDASFGQPNIPRIRGQYADMFYNGMRDSFTLNGYGAPISFNMVDTIDIIKGPASVQGGPGSGVGGSIDVTTKMPSMTKFAASFSAEGDTQQKRIFGFDIGGPLGADTAGRVSFTSNDSGSYYYDMFFHQQSLYAAVIHDFTPDYTVSLNGSIWQTNYRENDGINRANQALIDNGTYLTGGAVTPIQGYGTLVDYTGTTQLNPRTIIDEPDGTGARALRGMLQLIQTYRVSDSFSIVNNTFYDYVNRYNQTMDYYADGAQGSFSLENKTDFKLKFPIGFVNSDIDAGVTYRYLHVRDIQNYNNEPVGAFDLSQNPDTWVFPADQQGPSGGAILYSAAFGHQQYGVASDNFIISGTSVETNLQDAAIFLEHRLQFSPQWSLLYGLRGDLVQLDDYDPLYDAVAADPAVNWSTIAGYQTEQHSAWYGLYNGNISLVWSPTDWISGYLTYNKAQYTLANDNDGSINTLGEDPTVQLRQNTLLEEAGVKFDLLNKALFASIAGFKQERAVPIGLTGHSQAHITGAEFELNYQPDPHFFATASYSYLHTILDTPAAFWNFPAQPGLFIDGSGNAANYGALDMWEPNQKFVDPGVPAHLLNFLVNYKLDNGLGVQANLQVTGPVQISQGGYVNIANVEADMQAAFGPTSFVGLPAATVAAAYPTSIMSGYFTPPTIPWQYTLNAGVFYNFLQHYTVKFEVYNLTDRRNYINDMSFYGNDFLTREPPRSFDLTFTGKF